MTCSHHPTIGEERSWFRERSRDYPLIRRRRWRVTRIPNLSPFRQRTRTDGRFLNVYALRGCVGEPYSGDVVALTVRNRGGSSGAEGSLNSRAGRFGSESSTVAALGFRRIEQVSLLVEDGTVVLIGATTPNLIGLIPPVG